jgi:hypothetical protein
MKQQLRINILSILSNQTGFLNGVHSKKKNNAKLTPHGVLCSGYFLPENGGNR